MHGDLKNKKGWYLIKEAAAYGGGSVEETVAVHGYSVGASVAMGVAVAVLIACSSQAAWSVHFFPFCKNSRNLYINMIMTPIHDVFVAIDRRKLLYKNVLVSKNEKKYLRM